MSYGFISHISQIVGGLKKSDLAEISRIKSFKHGEIFGPHNHKRVEVNYVRKGACTMDFEGTEVNFNMNEIMIVFPFVNHSFKPHSQGVEIVQLEFSPDLFSMIAQDNQIGREFTKGFFKNKQKFIKIVNENEIASGLTRLVQELIEEEEAYEMLVFIYYAELLLLIFRYIKNTVNETNNKILNDILSVINTSYTNDICSSKIAMEFGISDRYLRKLFSHHVGVCFVNYINSLRISKAKELLKYSTYSIKEIAHQIGFNSTEYFVRVFKQIAQLSPSEFKANFKNIH